MFMIDISQTSFKQYQDIFIKFVNALEKDRIHTERKLKQGLFVLHIIIGITHWFILLIS